MPRSADFRNYAFDKKRVDASGKDVGRNVYWKLYATENLVRILVHSVLTIQVGPNWWKTAVDPDLQRRVETRVKDYAQRTWHSSPGKHEVYYTFLSDLSKVIAANSHLFEPIVTDIDLWVGRIEQIRLPRNIVGHMNWITTADRQRIDLFYHDFQRLFDQLANGPLAIAIPA
jgi:hypothetical protein